MEQTFQMHNLWVTLANLNAFRNIEGLSFKYQYRAKRLLEKLMPEVKAYEEIRTQMIKEYVALDEQGRPKVEKGMMVFKSQEAQAEYEKQINPIADEEITIDFRPLRIEMSDFGDMHPPRDVMDIIEPICEIIDEVEDDIPQIKVVK